MPTDIYTPDDKNKSEPELICPFDLSPEEQANLDALVDPDAGPTKFHFEEVFQKKMLGMLLSDQTMLKELVPLLNPMYFSSEAHVTIARLLKEHWQTYNVLPERFVVAQALQDALKEREKAVQIYFGGELYALYEYYVPGLESRQVLIDRFRTFAKVQEFKIAFHKGIELIDSSPEKIDEATATVISGLRNVQKLAGVRAECEGLSVADLMALAPPSWQIADHVPKGAFVCLFGPAKNYKSFVALDWALCLASGRPYLDRFAVQQGPVCYVCSEGGLFNFAKRIACWAEGKEVEREEFENNLQVFGTRFDFQKAENADALMEASSSFFGKYPDTFIIDTLSRNFGAGDPNSNKDMQNFCSTLDYLREKTGATIIVVHHTGWNEQDRERSASNLRDSLEVSIRVKREDDGLGIVTCVAQKDAPEFPPYRIRGRLVVLNEGDQLANASLVFDWDGEETEAKRVEREQARSIKDDERLATLLKPLVGRTHPNMGMTQAQITKESDLHKSFVSRHLPLAVQRGLVGKSGEQQGALYYLTQAGQEMATRQVAKDAIG